MEMLNCLNVVKILNSEKQVLENITKQKTADKKLIIRAQMILKCAEGKTNKEVAALLNLNEETVGAWRKSFEAQGMKCLMVKKKSTKLRTYDLDTTYRQILKKIEEPPPQGKTVWDGETLAQVLGISKGIVWEILRNEGISLQRTRTWFVGTNKELMAKSINIIGLYLNPPENALVICVDENPKAKVFEEQRGYVETSHQKVITDLKNNHKKYGSLCLLTALHTVKGKVESKLMQEKKPINFQVFLDKVLDGVHPDQEVHVILEDCVTHKKENNWSVQYPHVCFYLTQTSDHWLAQVEILLSILTNKHLRNSDFNSIKALKIAVQDFINTHHINACPFVWKKREG